MSKNRFIHSEKRNQATSIVWLQSRRSRQPSWQRCVIFVPFLVSSLTPCPSALPLPPPPRLYSRIGKAKLVVSIMNPFKTSKSTQLPRSLPTSHWSSLPLLPTRASSVKSLAPRGGFFEKYYSRIVPRRWSNQPRSLGAVMAEMTQEDSQTYVCHPRCGSRWPAALLTLRCVCRSEVF